MELSLYALHHAIHFRLLKEILSIAGKRDAAQAVRGRMTTTGRTSWGAAAASAGEFRDSASRR
jgi:hypothetical protein